MSTEFPDRPDHPDFWLISEALLDADAQADAGQGTKDILGRMINAESVSYAAIQRAQLAVARSRISVKPSQIPVLAAMWLEGMMIGMQVQRKVEERDQVSSTTQQQDVDLIIAALSLARERVTGDSAMAKVDKRVRLNKAIDEINTWLDGHGTKPSAMRLREMLSDPDARDIRQALGRWDEEPSDG